MTLYHLNLTDSIVELSSSNLEISNIVLHFDTISNSNRFDSFFEIKNDSTLTFIVSENISCLKIFYFIKRIASLCIQDFF